MPAPPLLEAINRNALAVFLLVRLPPFLLLVIIDDDVCLEWQANVMTGVVNLSMRTMYVSDRRAMCVLAAYAFGVCLFAWAFRGRRVWKL
jgi:phosphatidylinositol glycan class W